MVEAGVAAYDRGCRELGGHRNPGRCVGVDWLPGQTRATIDNCTGLAISEFSGDRLSDT
jgi:hypothetical protein